MSNWKPMTEHMFPWPHDSVIVAAYFEDNPAETEIFRCRVIEHGAFQVYDSTFMTLHEDGWIPYAWKVDDMPERDDQKWPPMLTDYLTANKA